MVEALEVVDYSDWKDEDPRFLRELLLLPCFGQLQVLDCRVNFDGDDEELLGTLAVYALHTEGAPCLRYLNLPYFLDSSPLGLQFKPLFDHGFANLTSLHFSGLRANAVAQLVSIYRAGGLAKLEKLTFNSVVFDDQTMDVWMKGVLASGHRGAALRELNAGFEVEATTGAHLIFIDALKEGAFPNLEALWDGGEFPFFEDDGVNDKVVKDSFLAMAGGAPCARTLRSTRLGEVTEDYFKALQEALPGIYCWVATAQVVTKKKKTKK
jgi:hypothetical protein